MQRGDSLGPRTYVPSSMCIRTIFYVYTYRMCDTILKPR